jgi:hypothetical protein
MTDAISSTKPEVPAPIQEVKDKPFVLLGKWEVDETRRFATRAEARAAVEVEFQEGNTRVQYIAKVVARVKAQAPAVQVIDEDI